MGINKTPCCPNGHMTRTEALKMAESLARGAKSTGGEHGTMSRAEAAQVAAHLARRR